MMPHPITEGVVPWPAEAAAEYRRRGYWQDRAVTSHILDQVDRRPDATAVVDGATRLTYRELFHRVDAAADRLAELGLVHGDRVVIQLPNTWEFIALTLACFRIGVAPVMALPAHRRHEMSYLAEHSEAVALVVPGVVRDFDYQEMAAEIAANTASVERVFVLADTARPGHLSLSDLFAPVPAPENSRRRWDGDAPTGTDVACFLLSGGTTGLPKLITRTHNDYAYNALQSARMCDLDSCSVYLVAVPVSHNFPLACPGVLGVLMTGGTAVMADSPSPAKVFPMIAAEGVTITAVVPAVAARWLDHHLEHPSDQLATRAVRQVGGSRMPNELAARIKPMLGATLQQVFGMAEGLINVTHLDDPDEIIFGTQGRPMCDADEILIVDDADVPVPAGASGALLTRGPYTPRGYYRAPEQNQRAFTADGWYRTGDICSVHPSGNLVVEGRDKDMINRGGEKISAEEIENFGYQVPGVAEVAAVAMPDPTLGERLCVYVVPRPGTTVTLDEFTAVMRQAGVATFKLPEVLVSVEALPTTKVGKIDKKGIRADLQGRLSAGLIGDFSAS
jgi:2,3-dihydroxybenzoate-AMP ligase